jgi:hypothetical protein
MTLTLGHAKRMGALGPDRLEQAVGMGELGAVMNSALVPEMMQLALKPLAMRGH